MFIVPYMVVAAVAILFFIVCRLRHYYQRMRIIILFALCRYAHSCAFISVIKLPRIPAYCPKT